MKLQKLDFNIFQFIKNIRVAALFTGAAILFFSCEKNNLEQIKAFTLTDDLPVVEAENYESLTTDSGEVRFFLKAPKLLQFDVEGKTHLEFPAGIELIKYDANHQIISSITADFAKQFPDEDKWEAKNNVVATNAAGDTLKTEHLIFEQDAGKIYSEEFVRIIRPDQIITGIGFVSDQSMQNWKIKDPKGTIYVAVEENSQHEGSTESVQRDSVKETPPFKRPLQFENN